MFGYVTADWTQLDEAQRQRYRACYCGLCRALRQDFSQPSRLALTYDITFLVLLLASLYEPEETAGSARCPAHPLRRQDHWLCTCTEYGAAMNVILAYYNCLDDWRDDRSPLKWAEARLLRRPCRKAEGAYPRQAAAVARELERLSALERRGIPDPDGAANCFGRLLGELFVPDPEDRWAGLLRTVGEGLGRFVYILDAAVDLPEDLRQGRYNPLSAMAAQGCADFREHLELLIGESTAAFERLPLVQDAALLRNILYAGVWLPYTRAMHRQTTKEGGPRP